MTRWRIENVNYGWANGEWNPRLRVWEGGTRLTRQVRVRKPWAAYPLDNSDATLGGLFATFDEAADYVTREARPA